MNKYICCFMRASYLMIATRTWLSCLRQLQFTELCPTVFLYSTIVPIPKGKHGNMSDSSNFRGITLSSIYGKPFDNIVLFRYGERLLSSELRFGF